LSESREMEFTQKIQQVFTQAKNRYSGEKVLYNWSTSSLFEGSYSAYKIGQWSTIAGEEKRPVGNIYFAGEHCSEDFQGYMNGGAETGRIAAEEVIKIIRSTHDNKK
jgi:monoamine oxidase